MTKRTISLSLEDKKDEKVSWYVGAYFISSAANMTMKTVLPIPQDLWGLVSLFWGVVILFFMLRGGSVVLKRSKGLISKSLLAFLLIFAWSYMLITFRGEPTKVLTNEIAIPTLMFWLPVGIYACSVRNMEILYHVMVKTSFVILGLLITCFLFRNNVEMYGEEAQSYNMFFGYSMAFVSLFHMNEYYRKRKIYYLILFIAEVLLIILYANRGALLSIVFFVFVKLILDQQKVGMKIFWTLCLGIAAIVLINLSSIMAESAISFFGSYNIESRTLQKMASDTFVESEARDELRTVAMRMIGERPILGWGVGGECITIGSKMGMAGVVSHAYSPHNGIIQHMLYFGVIAGNIINLLLILPIFRLNRIKNEYQHGLVLICCSAYFITTLWSSCDILLKPAVAIYIYLVYFYKTKNYGIIKQ